MDQEIRDRNAEKKGIAKYHAYDKFHAQESEIAEGEKVLLKQQNENELPSNFEAESCEIVSKKVNRVFKPNVTHVKKYSEPADDNVC